MLEYYSMHFNSVELNFTYYTIPVPRIMEAIVRKSSEEVLFSVKLNRDITHSEDTDEEVWEKFADGIIPLKESGVLGVLLAQFPWSFKNEETSWNKLNAIAERFSGENMAVEFRNSSWAKEQVRDRLKQLNLTFCVVDEPPISTLMPWKKWLTSDITYIRLHGRNSSKWFHHQEPSERYDYLYTEDELKELIPDILELTSDAKSSFIFFNNHPLGKAVENAKMLIDMLSEED